MKTEERFTKPVIPREQWGERYGSVGSYKGRGGGMKEGERERERGGKRERYRTGNGTNRANHSR